MKKVIGGDGNTKRIDVYIPETHVLIEQKSLGIPLDKPQAGHGGMTPYEQAKMYDNYLPFDERARWIVTSNVVQRNEFLFDAVRHADKILGTVTEKGSFFCQSDAEAVSGNLIQGAKAGMQDNRGYKRRIRKIRKKKNEKHG